MSQMSPMELVTDAEAALEAGNVPKATELMGAALAAAPRDATVLTAFGSMLAEVGNTEKAVLTLKKAARLAPDSGYEKFMYLGQLLDDVDEADAAYCAGIELLKGDIDKSEPEGCTDGSALRPSLASAICSLVELRIRSVDDVSSISDSCAELLEQASEIDPDSPEPEQALASLRHELGDLDEALHLLRSSMDKWWRPNRDEQPCKEDKDSCKSGGRQPGNNEMQSSDSDTESSDGQLPSYELRLEACKLLIELDTSTDVAVEVLESLLCENDEAPHTWYLLALAHYGGGDFDAAADTLQHGTRCMTTLSGHAHDDAQELYHELRERIQEGRALVEEDA